MLMLAANALKLLEDHVTLQAPLVQEFHKCSRICYRGERCMLAKCRLEWLDGRHLRVCCPVVPQEIYTTHVL